MNQRINDLCPNIIKILQMNNPRPSPKNEKKHDFDENKIPNRLRANKIYLTRNTQTINSPGIKGSKNNTSK